MIKQQIKPKKATYSIIRGIAWHTIYLTKYGSGFTAFVFQNSILHYVIQNEDVARMNDLCFPYDLLIVQFVLITSLYSASFI